MSEESTTTLERIQFLEDRNAELLEQLADKDSAIKELQDEKILLETENADLKHELANSSIDRTADKIKKAAEGPRKLTIPPPVDAHGKKWRFTLVSFRRDGKSILAEEAALDPAMIEEILKIPNQTILKEVI
jgi:hypothetical protein